MQETHSSNPPVVTGICDPNNFRARHYRSLKIGSKLKYFNIIDNFWKSIVLTEKMKLIQTGIINEKFPFSCGTQLAGGVFLKMLKHFDVKHFEPFREQEM